MQFGEVHQFTLKQNRPIRILTKHRNICMNTHFGLQLVWELRSVRTYGEKRMEVIDHNDSRKKRKNARTKIGKKTDAGPVKEEFYCFHESICKFAAYMRLIYCTLVTRWQQRPPKKNKVKVALHDSQGDDVIVNISHHQAATHLSVSRTKTRKFKPFPGLTSLLDLTIVAMCLE